MSVLKSVISQYRRMNPTTPMAKDPQRHMGSLLSGP
jgi:hypothetical protein